MPGPLAAKIRALYPGAYTDLSDDELEQAVVKKYPVYQNLADPKNAFTPESQATAELSAQIGTTSGLGLPNFSDSYVDEAQRSRFGPSTAEEGIIASAPQLPGALPSGPQAKAPRGLPKPPHQQMDGIVDLMESAGTGAFGPQAQSQARWALAPMAARVAGPIAGQVIGGGVGSLAGGVGALPGTLAGGAIGGAAGDLIGQGIENLEESVTGIPRRREGFNPLAAGVATVAGAIPAANMARVGNIANPILRAGALIGARTAEGAGVNLAVDAAYRKSEGGNLLPTKEEALFSAVPGAAAGGALGAAEAILRAGRSIRSVDAPNASGGDPAASGGPSAGWTADAVPDDAARVGPGGLEAQAPLPDGWQRNPNGAGNTINGSRVKASRVADTHPVSGKPIKYDFMVEDGRIFNYDVTTGNFSDGPGKAYGAGYGSAQAIAGPVAAAAVPEDDDSSVDEALRIALLGAGAAGMAAAINIPQELRTLARAIKVRDGISDTETLAARLRQEIGDVPAGPGMGEKLGAYALDDAADAAGSTKPPLFSRLDSEVTALRTAPGKDAPPEVLDAVFGKPNERQKVWTGDKLLKWFEKRGVVTEMNERGLTPFLKSKGSQTVTRDEVADFLGKSGAGLEVAQSAPGGSVTGYNQETLKNWSAQPPQGMVTTGRDDLALTTTAPTGSTQTVTDDVKRLALEQFGVVAPDTISGVGDYFSHNFSSRPNVVAHQRGQFIEGRERSDEIRQLQQDITNAKLMVHDLATNNEPDLYREWSKELMQLREKLVQLKEAAPEVPRTYLIDELQSDSHQEAVRGGYREDAQGKESAIHAEKNELLGRMQEHAKFSVPELVVLRDQVRAMNPQWDLEPPSGGRHARIVDHSRNMSVQLPRQITSDENLANALDHILDAADGLARKLPQLNGSVDDQMLALARGGDAKALALFEEWATKQGKWKAIEQQALGGAPGYFPLRGKNQQGKPDPQEWTRALAKAASVRAIRGGAEQIAMPTGSEVQARFQRDGQGATITKISWNPDNGNVTVVNDRGETKAMGSYDADKLYAVVGEEVATKLIAGQANIKKPAGEDGPLFVTQVDIHPTGMAEFHMSDGTTFEASDDHIMDILGIEGADQAMLAAEGEPGIASFFPEGQDDVRGIVENLGFAKSNKTVDLDIEPTTFGKGGLRTYYDKTAHGSLRSVTEKLTGEHVPLPRPALPAAAGGDPATTPGRDVYPLPTGDDARVIGEVGQPSYGAAESAEDLKARLRQEGIGAKQALRQVAPDMPWSSEYGKARLEVLSTIAGSFLGSAAGMALGDEDDRLFWAVLGGLAGGAAGAGFGAAYGRKPSQMDVDRVGMLAQHPTVKPRLTHNTTPGRTKALVANAVAEAQKTFGTKHITDFELKKADPVFFKDAIDRLAKYRNDRFAIPANSRDLLDTVLMKLGNRPDHYDLFNDITRLRRDMEVYRQNPQAALETNMDPAQAASYLTWAEQYARANAPDVMNAVDAHHDLMHQIGGVLIQWGKLDPVIAADNPHYLSDYVMAYLSPRPAVGPRTMRGGLRAGFLRHREGGSRETLRDYIEVVYRYLNETQQAIQKDALIKNLATVYDPRVNGMIAPGAAGNQPPFGYSNLNWPPDAPKPQQFWLPDELKSTLMRQIAPTSKVLQAINRVTAAQKSIILRGAGGAYLGNNFLGDFSQVYAESTAPWRLGGQTLKAMEASWLYHWKDVDPATLNPRQRQLYDLAQQAEQLNVGGAGAAAEIEEQVLRDPLIRGVKQSTSAGPLKKAASGVRDITTDAVALYEAWRGFQENWPRITLMLNQMDSGMPPPEAATTARVALGDYADRTEFMAKYISGFFLPFFQWTDKMMGNLVPGFKGPGTFTERQGRDLKAALKLKGPWGKLAKVAPFTLAAMVWNEALFPQAEAMLEEWERDQFHLLLPYGVDERGRVQLLYVGFSSPWNAVGRAFGVGGMYNRAKEAGRDLYRGRDPWLVAKDQLERSRSQSQMFWGGSVNPLLRVGEQTISTLRTGKAEDWRTGRDLFKEEDPTSTKVWALTKELFTGIPPFSGVASAMQEGQSVNEDLMAFAKRFVFGSFVKKVVPDERRIFQASRAMAMGKQEGQQWKEQRMDELLVQPMMANLSGQDPQKALSVYLMMGNSAAMRPMKSALTNAAQGLAKENKAWRETAKALQFMQNNPAWYEKPFIFKRFLDGMEDPSAYEAALAEAAAARRAQGAPTQ